ncbi:Alpha-D-QuiNAc alpha-1,3-galactosyltransferase [Candidatus Coxiella mudrowiae]|uniref:Alpha-D-QuiNAc alpha-1,3-galactosyltransferase n=2 Tax=Candidatus Coxiella mudrowiae TaxID=2054173 RepID=A0ABM5UUY3_9COXI|nr:Alpha-D-QuiNAc alpha-1,3-galactosyltransferase [Candidatus Coxiella mudrowiae]
MGCSYVSTMARAELKKKLLIVVSSAKFFISHRLSLAQAAKAAGYDVHVATPDYNEQISEVGLVHHTIILDRGSLNPAKDVGAFFSLLRLYQKLKPDIVHHVTVKPILYGGIAARLARIPVEVNAFTGLGFIFIAQSRFMRLIHKMMQKGYQLAFGHRNMRVIFQNKNDQEYFIQANILKENKTILIPGSGVCMKTFYPIDEPAGLVRVVFASRLLWDKGVGEFVDAARLLKKRKVNAQFVLVGAIDAANPTAISDVQLEQWEKEGLIEWWGERTDMPQIMREAHIICLPSYREGLSRVLIEASASGRAIVTTDVPGCRDLVHDGENGLLVPMKDSEELALAIETLIQNPSLRKQMGFKGRAMVEKEHELKRIIQHTLNLYEELSEQQCHKILNTNQ